MQASSPLPSDSGRKSESSTDIDSSDSEMPDISFSSGSDTDVQSEKPGPLCKSEGSTDIDFSDSEMSAISVSSAADTDMQNEKPGPLCSKYDS